MRGLTLLELSLLLGTSEQRDSTPEELAALHELLAVGRVSRITVSDRARRWLQTDLGRLAVRVCPRGRGAA